MNPAGHNEILKILKWSILIELFAKWMKYQRSSRGIWNHLEMALHHQGGIRPTWKIAESMFHQFSDYVPFYWLLK